MHSSSDITNKCPLIFALIMPGGIHFLWFVRFMILPNITLGLVINAQAAGLGGSFGCAVRLETRRWRVQPPPRSATFFRGDWSWNIFYGHSLPSADSRRVVISFWRKNVHNTGKPLRGISLPVNVWLDRLIALDITPLGWLGRKTSTQTNNKCTDCVYSV